MFDSHLSYSWIAWAQFVATVNRSIIIQKKALRIMNFKDQLLHSSPLFSANNILKSKTYIKIFFLSVNQSTDKCFLYFTIDLHFPEICTDMKLADPVDIYLLKVKNRNTRTRCDAIGVVLVSLLLTLNMFHTLF